MNKYVFQMKVSSKIRKRVQYQRFVLLIYLSIVFPLSPQVKAQVGFKMGVTTSTFYYPGNSPTPYDGYEIDLRPYLGYDVGLVQTNPQKPLTSLYISVFKRIELSERIGFQPEISFSQKGVDFSNSKYESIIYKVKINYLDIPLSLSYQYLQKEKTVSNCYIGGFTSFRINSIKKTTSHNSPTQKKSFNAVKNFDFGVHAGVDLKYRLKNHFLLFDIRFFLGLNDVLFIPEGWTNIYYESHKTKITGINLSIGYEI